ncbi:MAG: hypothetical protein GY829_00905, partial [Gammaproteobacteria bacterium]|nr:hypothetical protein [Gammaproteobacteria bacterium]
QAAVAAMPAAERAALVAKEFDVEIIEVQESHSTLRAMLESDARNPHTTRPFIAKWSFIVVALITVLIVIMWSYAVAMQDAPLVKEIASGWAFVAAALAPFVWLLKSYFGTLTAEHRDRLGAAGGNHIAPAGLAGLIASFVKK